MDGVRTLRIEKLASGGDGLAFDGGKAVFVPRSVPGELIEARIVDDRSDYSRAELLRVLESSPDRVEPLCPLFGICGGCTLQHMSHSSQLEAKAKAVRESFVRTAGFDPGLPRIESGVPYGYRNRIQVHTCADGGLGFMRAGETEAVRAKGCPIADSSLDAWLVSENRKSKPARSLAAAYGIRERFVVFGQAGRLYLEGRDAKARALVGDEEYEFPLQHFFQANLDMAGRLAHDAVSGLGGARAADLYCGAGLFGKLLAKTFGEVLCVESDTVSLEAARANLPRGKARFFAQSVEQWISGAAANRSDARIDWVLADPPRQGLSAESRTWLTHADIDGFSYVSCDPVTMARDIGELVAAGMRLETLALYDFYPQTGHFEALAKMRRG